MKSNIPRFLVVLIGGFLLAGCASRSQHAVTVTPSGEVMLPDREDHVRREQAGLSGVVPYSWSKGYWTFEDGHWVWVPGQWLQPVNSANWVEGHWEHATDGWVWVPGHPA